MPPEHGRAGPQDELNRDLFEKVELAKCEWEATVDSLSELVCMVDERGVILRSNRSVESWRLGPVVAVSGRSFHSVLHPWCSDPACYVEPFLREARGGSNANNFTEIELFDSILDRFIRLRARPVRENRRVTGCNLVVIVEDVTERRQAEQAVRGYTERLELMNLKLEQTNQELQEALRAKDEMIRVVSHELRTPLIGVLGYGELLASESMGPLNAEQQEALAAINHSGQRLNHMVDRMLVLQMLESTTPTKVTIAMPRFLQQMVQRWEEHFSDAGIGLSCEVAAGADELVGDPDLLRQLVHDLLDNALKFSLAGGNVCLRAWRDASQYLLAVSDQGIGIAADKLEKVFERFYQVDRGLTRSFGGMGIGLALCHKIVSAHGGRIWAESLGEGQGACFYVSLPALPPAGELKLSGHDHNRGPVTQERQPCMPE